MNPSAGSSGVGGTELNVNIRLVAFEMKNIAVLKQHRTKSCSNDVDLDTVDILI